MILYINLFGLQFCPRYQGLSPENLPLSNGRRSHWRTCKEDDGIIGNKEIDDESDATKTVPNGGSGSGDMLLQWGHRKRSRISRSVENRSVGTPIGGSGLADDSSSSSSTQLQAMMKVPRRSITLPTPGTNTAGFIETKNSSITNIMPPPSSILPDKILITASAPTNSSTSNGKVGSHKSSSKDNSSFVNRYVTFFLIFYFRLIYIRSFSWIYFCGQRQIKIPYQLQTRDLY